MKSEFTPDPTISSDRPFVEEKYEPLGKEVYVKKETGLDAMAGDGGYKKVT